MKKYFAINIYHAIILFCICVSLFLRLYNFDWDQGLYFHPDERNIANAVTKIHFFSELNPHFFAYGGFSVYLYRATGDLLVAITHNARWVTDWGRIDDIGRIYSAVFSTITLLPLFFVAKKLFGQKTAALSILFYTFTVTSIQHAHFATTESILALLGILLCLLSILWLEKPTWIKSLLLGIVFGISLATKSSALMFIIFPAISGLLFVLAQRKNFKKILQFIFQGFIFAASASAFAFAFSPYSVLDVTNFMASMHYESGVAIGTIPVVYTMQFIGSTPYVFQIQNFIWQLGPLLTIFSIIGMALLIIEPLQKSKKNLLLFWVFPLVYFMYVGSWHTKFLRYMIPVVPFFVIAASMLLIRMHNRFRKIGNAFILLTLVTTTLWASAFFSIYTRPQTRIAASAYIYQHVFPNAILLTESWDDGLPVTVGINNGSKYQGKQLDMYSTDDPQKIVYLSTMLNSADYIIINSRRLYGTLTRPEAHYPITSNYYRLLFTGKLGYENVGIFSSYPQLFGVTINDDSSEETFQVYDHPKVLIFKNEGHYSVQKLMQILNPADI